MTINARSGGEGVTPTEQYLARLCRRSFLSLWSYPNVYNDDGVQSPRRIGQEVCDLLVVFGDDVLVFSDKSCEYKDSGRIRVDWNRWYKKAVLRSAQQLHGAERWIRCFPRRLFLDPYGRKPFPINLDGRPGLRFHKIAVATGAKEACHKFFGGGSGSLMISTGHDAIITSDDEEEISVKAFTISYGDRSRGIVHVFDDVTLDVVMSELDTILDFCRYLRKKEALLETYHVVAPGEEDMLAQYLKDINENKEHDFVISTNSGDKIDGVRFEEGTYASRLSNNRYIAKKKEDEISYVWDRLIEHFYESFRDDERINDGIFSGYEMALRKMAALGRTERRSVGRLLKAIFERTPPGYRRLTSYLPGTQPGTAIIFLLLPWHDNRSQEQYTEERETLLGCACEIFRLKNPHIKDAVAIGLQPPETKRSISESLGYFDFSGWDEELESQAIRAQQITGFFTKETYHESTEQEYPEVKKLASFSIPLGSGRMMNRKERRRAAALSRKPRR